MAPRVDPIRLEIMKNLFHSVAEEMGAALRRSAFSPNIRERRDYSCAVFDAHGDALAMGDHMPVHLGSMPMSVAAALAAFPLHPGDVAILNDPYAGGTHLPDITLVMPVFAAGAGRPAFYVSSRAHHADVGGAQAGSMALTREIFAEGVRIPPVKLCRRGGIDRDVLALVLANVRTPEERQGDLTAQIAACRTGTRRLEEITARYGARETAAYSRHLLDYSERMMRATLRGIPPGRYSGEDFLDDDGVTAEPVRIRVTITARGDRALVDFAGSAAQCAGSINAVEAITVSAVYYAFRCLLDEQVPATAGLLRPIRVLAPLGTVVNARPPCAVAGGNVEASQRIVDTLLRALSRALPERVPAASQGTMNNFSFGGVFPAADPRAGTAYTYYETIAGGLGARPGADGISGVHNHMTNSLNTPAEVLEHAYPVRVRRYGLRSGSGGRGRWRGGDGIVREVEFLAPAEVSLLSDRRRIGPYGLAGGSPGATGKNTLLRGKRERPLASKTSFAVEVGDVLRIESPGGGGWGAPLRRKERKGKQEPA